MKKMIKTTLITSVTLACLSTLNAKDTQLLPVMDADYCAGWGLALMAGYGQTPNDNSKVDTGGVRFGIEASLACPLLQLSAGDIRQQLSVVYADEDGFTTTSIEMNPYFMVDVAKSVQVGFGPSLGVTLVSVDNAGTSTSDTVFGAGLGANINYDLSQTIFLGADARYQWTTNSDDFGTIDNFRTMLKVGMHF